MNIPLTCPNCGQELHCSSNELHCTGCGQSYAQTLEIPDLRFPKSDRTPAEDGIVSKMLSHYPQASFADLLEIRLQNAPTYHELRGHETGYMLQHDERGREMIEMFQARLADYYPLKGFTAALDIGCGMGAGLPSLAQKYAIVAGLDPSLPDLILAKKAMESQGLTNYQLIQAHGQRVPFPEGSFDYINALNVLEHVFDVGYVLGEVHRLLKTGGLFAADSRNRFDLFFPEPHVKIRWVGVLPRKWAKRYVRWRLGVGYDTIQLLSYTDLHRGLRAHFCEDYRIIFPYVSAYGGPAWLNGWLKRLERLPSLANLVLWIFPSHLALACRR